MAQWELRQCNCGTAVWLEELPTLMFRGLSAYLEALTPHFQSAQRAAGIAQEDLWFLRPDDDCPHCDRAIWRAQVVTTLEVVPTEHELQEAAGRGPVVTTEKVPEELGLRMMQGGFWLTDWPEGDD